MDGSIDLDQWTSRKDMGFTEKRSPKHPPSKVSPFEAGPDGISLGDCPFTHSMQMALGGGGSSTGDDLEVSYMATHGYPKRDGFYIVEIPNSKMDDMGICMIG
jgi:hypothetical protein